MAAEPFGSAHALSCSHCFFCYPAHPPCWDQRSMPVLPELEPTLHARGNSGSVCAWTSEGRKVSPQLDLTFIKKKEGNSRLGCFFKKNT